MHELILASQSPRRKMLLEKAGYRFRTLPIEVSEIPGENLNPIEQICDWARLKAAAAVKALKLSESKDILILSADTVVVLEGQILGKPKNTTEACETLGRLSGKKHQVITAYCLWDLGPDRFILRHVVSDVEFKVLKSEEIEDYVASGDPMDKAGSYGIQGEARKFVKSFSGSFDNIVGLPVEDVDKTVTENGWSLARAPQKN